MHQKNQCVKCTYRKPSYNNKILIYAVSNFSTKIRFHTYQHKHMKCSQNENPRRLFSVDVTRILQECLLIIFLFKPKGKGKERGEGEKNSRWGQEEKARRREMGRKEKAMQGSGGPITVFQYLKVKLQKTQVLPVHKKPHREDKKEWVPDNLSYALLPSKDLTR